jgi:fumarate hydratase subunit beta
MEVYKLRTPLSREDVEKLRVGDIVYISGTLYTARDQAHKRIVQYLREGKPLPFNPRDSAIYHCGPVVIKKGSEWNVISAGPTTSTRMEVYEYEVIEKLGVRMVIGKGGMGPRTAEACRKFGAVYVTFTGGAGVLAAQTIKRVVDAHWLDLGIPEAIWILEVENFGPLIVAIDTTGRNLHEEIMMRARLRKETALHNQEYRTNL